MLLLPLYFYFSLFPGLVLPKAFTGKVLTCKFFSCLLAVGSGLPAGPEGPMIHMGGILGVIVSQGRVRRLIRCTPTPVRQWLESAVLTFRNARDRRDFMAAGVAGGVAAAFGAPVGGLLFVAEELATHWDVGLGMQVWNTREIEIVIAVPFSLSLGLLCRCLLYHVIVVVQCACELVPGQQGPI